MRYPKYILLLLVSCMFLASTATLRAQAEATKTEATTTTTTKEEQFNPTPMVMHHIADSHEWDIMEMVHIPLPCILYSSATGLTTFVYGDNKEVSGYKCEEGAIAREDGAFFLDLSITKNVLSLLISATLLILIFLSVTAAYGKNKGKAPKGLQAIIEPMIIFVRDEVAKPGIGARYEAFMPYILTIFFFILINNLLGLLPIFPGGANLTGNIAFTLALGVVAFIVINVNGTKHYWQHIFWMPGVAVPLKIFLAPIELAGVFIKPIALTMRLFANMAAGHITILSMICIIFIFGNAGKSMLGSTVGIFTALPLAIFSSVLEVLVAFLQPFIFAMLTSVFLGMALEDHSEGHHTVD